MTTTADDLHRAVHPGRQLVSLVLAILATVPGLYLRLADVHMDEQVVAALFFGLAIVGAAFVLSWAAEVAQLDISAGLALAVLAFIAVLPEYAVDLVFARKGGNAFEEFGRSCQSAADAAANAESPCSLALANMTGANRLLIGVGWSMVVFIAWWAMKRKGRGFEGITLERSHSVELSFLVLASAYSLTLPLKSTITLFDAAILVSIFVVYTIRISRAPAEEPHLVGPARLIGAFSDAGRRSSVIAMFLFAGSVIVLCAEHFAEALVDTGSELGVSEFFLVQWVAPFASEAPELLIAGLYAWRLNTNSALGTLVSSKVNQWTLLVGTLPIAFALSGGTLHGLPVDAVQREELFLTAAQSVFAIVVLTNLTLSLKEAGALLGLFMTQFFIAALVPEEYHEAERIVVGIAYLLAAFILGIRERDAFRRMLRQGFRTSYSDLVDPEFDKPPSPSAPRRS